MSVESEKARAELEAAKIMGDAAIGDALVQAGLYAKVRDLVALAYLTGRRDENEACVTIMGGGS